EHRADRGYGDSSMKARSVSVVHVLLLRASALFGVASKQVGCQLAGREGARRRDACLAAAVIRLSSQTTIPASCPIGTNGRSSVPSFSPLRQVVPLSLPRFPRRLRRWVQCRRGTG